MRNKLILVFGLIFILLMVIPVQSAWDLSLGNNLIYYWAMDHGSGTTATENVTGIKNITGLTGTGWTTGLLTQGYSPVSTTDKGITNINLTEFGVNFTMVFWVKITSYSGIDGTVFDSGSDITVNISEATGQIFTNLANGSFSPTLTTLDKWYMVVITKNHTGTGFYYDGVFLGSSSLLNYRFKGETFCLFHRGSSCSSGTSSNNMVIDEIGMWNKTLTSSDISNLYNGGLGTPYLSNRFTVTSQSYSNEVYETQNQTFIANITLDASATLFDASLIYNGTRYVVDSKTSLGSGSYQLIKTIDIPTVITNASKNFYWEVTMDFSGSGFRIENSTSSAQNVSATNITNLNIAPVSINYTLYDEETLQPISAGMQATKNWYLGTGTVKENVSFNLGAPRTHFNFTVHPNFRNFYVDSVIRINTSNYQARTFNFIATKLNETVKEQPLYLLSNSNGTNVIIETKDAGLSALENYLITIERYYPASNTYRMIEQKTTDAFGQITARLIENDVTYRFTFRNPQNEVVKVLTNVIVACRSSICIAQFIIEDPLNIIDDFQSLQNYNANLSWNNNTRVFLATWADNRGEGSVHRLMVTKFGINGTTVLYNQSSTSQTGTLTYTVGNEKASYKTYLYRKVGNKEIRVLEVSASLSRAVDTFGREGLIWSLILLGTMLALGSFSPPAGIVMYLLGFIILGVSDIVYINPAIMIAELIIGVLFIWAFKG